MSRGSRCVPMLSRPFGDESYHPGQTGRESMRTLACSILMLSRPVRCGKTSQVPQLPRKHGTRRTAAGRAGARNFTAHSEATAYPGQVQTEGFCLQTTHFTSTSVMVLLRSPSTLWYWLTKRQFPFSVLYPTT